LKKIQKKTTFQKKKKENLLTLSVSSHFPSESFPTKTRKKEKEKEKEKRKKEP